MSTLIDTLSADFVTRYARDLYHCSSCNYCVDAVWPERGMQGVCATIAARMVRARLPQVGMAVSLDARCASHMRAYAEEGVEVLGFASFVARYFDVAARSPS